MMDIQTESFDLSNNCVVHVQFVRLHNHRDAASPEHCLLGYWSGRDYRVWWTQ